MCELGSDLIRPMQPLFPEPWLLLIPSALPIGYLCPRLPSSYLTALESHPCTRREGNSHGITSLRKKWGVGGSWAHLPCQTSALSGLGSDAPAGEQIPAVPSFPDVADQHAGQEVVRRADPLKDAETHQGHQHGANDLIRVPDGRSGRVCKDEEREKERGMKIRRPKHFGDPARLAHVGSERKQAEIDAQENQRQRKFVHAVRDEDARGGQQQQSPGCDFRQSAPPALPRIENVERGYERQGRRIEDVGRASARNVFAGNGYGRRASP